MALLLDMGVALKIWFYQTRLSELVIVQWRDSKKRQYSELLTLKVDFWQDHVVTDLWHLGRKIPGYHFDVNQV